MPALRYGHIATFDIGMVTNGGFNIRDGHGLVNALLVIAAVVYVSSMRRRMSLAATMFTMAYATTRQHDVVTTLLRTYWQRPVIAVSVARHMRTPFCHVTYEYHMVNANMRHVAIRCV